MSKRITISLKDSVYKNMEQVAKKRNCSVRDLVNENIRNGFESKTEDQKDFQTSKDIKEIQELLSEMFKFIFESQKINIQQSTYCKNVIAKLARSVSKGTTEEEKDEKINEVYKSSIAESDEIMKNIITGVN
jgi:metal-responsive CopG/Arc/MetJ family transcriptional regulator